MLNGGEPKEFRAGVKERAGGEDDLLHEAAPELPAGDPVGQRPGPFVLMTGQQLALTAAERRLPRVVARQPGQSALQANEFAPRVVVLF